MTRLSSILLLALGLLAAIGVFVLKHQVQGLEEELTGVNAKIEQHRENLLVLKAEWAHLNQPARLEELARRHLELQPLQPNQVVRLEDVPFRTAAHIPEALPDSLPSDRLGPTLASAGANP